MTMLAEPDELLDVYDQTGQRIGARPRSLVHRDGNWHRTFDCWIIFRDAAGEPCVLLQRRSEGKDTWPGRFDVSCAGHYLAGEGPADGPRELAEELGVAARLEQLLPLGVRINVARDRDRIDHELQDTFFLIDNRPLTAYRVPAAEVAGLAALRVREGLALFAGRVPAVAAPGVRVIPDRRGPRLEPTTYTLTCADFVPTLDQYYPKVFHLAARALDGERDLYI